MLLEEEISKSKLNGKSLILELDSNSKLGPKYIKDDPHGMSPYGAILSGIIERHGFVAANGLTQKRSGVITRRRDTVVRTGESVIDFVIVSSDMADDLVTIQIGENRRNVLTSFTKTKNGTKHIESGHNSIITQFNLQWKGKVKIPRKEIFKFNDEDGPIKLEELTSNNTKLSEIFRTDEDVNTQIKKVCKETKWPIASII